MAVAVAGGSTSSTSDDTVVWEYETDVSGIYAPYDEDVSNLLEQEYRTGTSQIVDLSTVNPGLHWRVDLRKGTQRSRNGSVRNIKRTKYSSQSLPGLQIVWEWMTDIGWVMFHIPTATEIEEAFQNGENEMDLEDTPLGIPNLISFLGMWQKNKWSGYIRPIQRRELDVGYMTDKPLANKPKAGKGKSRSPPKLSAPSGSSHQAQKNSSVVNEKKKIGKRGFKPQSRNNEMIKHPVLNQFCVIVNESVEEDCPICMDSLDEDSDMYHGGNHILELKSCHHKFHDSCLEACYENGNKDGSLQCPICKTIHGIKHGMQPPGTMTVTKINRSLPGHQGCGTIQITYMISSGIQGPNHRNPGQPYVAYGFPRIGYLPDNPKGRKVLNLLRKAWDRKLIFTIDQSVTTGVQNAVVWNEIHHKTEAYSNHSGHGYPDPNYLDNVLMELKAQGVRDSDDETS